jgi:hypothetical protein
MSDFGKRSLRERRAPKQFDEEVFESERRSKTPIPMDMAVPPTLRYMGLHSGLQNPLTAAQLGCQTPSKIHQPRQQE